jgi:glycosyltransferase involved in cell wall biosynthesis
MVKLSAGLIVKPTADEALMLGRCLESFHEDVDKIYITITGEKGECPELEKVCKDYKAKVSYFKWVKDFAKARNFNFSQIKEEYIFWCDADDIIEGSENFKEVLEKMIDEGVDVGVMDYLYDFDEFRNCTVKHRKGRIIKNDGCVKWVGELHEDLIDQRELLAYFIPDIKVIHTSYAERFDGAKDRNLDIALYVLSRDKDPRNYWNVANAYLSLNRVRDALEYFDLFVQVSGSEIEVFTARHRMALAYLALGHNDEAIEQALHCVKLKPWFPDGYLALGEIYLTQRDYKKGKEFLVTGLSKEIPEDEYIVWNPRDYDFNPLRLLAEAYLNLYKPKEAKICLQNCINIYPEHKTIRDEIEVLDRQIVEVDKVDSIIQEVKDNPKNAKDILAKVDDEIRDHPKLVSVKNQLFYKEKSSGKDLAIFCFYTAEEFNPDIVMKEGRGGSEEAVVHMADRLANLGWNVEVFANCGHKERMFGKVKWKPFWTFNYRDKYDVFISWRHPIAFNLNINADKKYVWLHDVLKPAEFTPERLKKIDRIFALSKYQRELFPDVSDDKFFITSNGIDLDLPDVERDPNRIIYTSSYDRGLKKLLQLFPKIRDKNRKAELHIFYGWHVWDTMHKDDPDMRREKQYIMDLMEQDGVYEHGRMSQEDIIKEYGKASVLAYPTEFQEISFISGMKAQAMGCVPVTTNVAALDETIQYGIKIDSGGIYSDKNAQEKFVEGVLEAMKTDDKGRKEMMSWARKHFDWDNVAKNWDKLFNEKI